MSIDLTQTLKDTENSLRDFVASVLETQLGSDWMNRCGVTVDRLTRWQERKTLEEKRQTGGVVEPRLIYYADFYDIKTILKKHWGKFSEALGDWKTMEVFLSQLELLRDPDAHRRELLPHQKHLAVGIAGEIRSRIIRYRSKLETSEDYFPRIESVRDSLGNIWTRDATGFWAFIAKQILRPGDVIDYVVTAGDPLGQALQYRMVPQKGSSDWQDENAFSLPISQAHIGKQFDLNFEIRSPRSHHAQGNIDDFVTFYYTVLPTK